MDKLFQITLLSLFIQAICQDPKIVCPEFVNEGDTLSCFCKPPDLKSFPHDFSLKWSRSGSTTLEVPNVTRANNGDVFTCSMMLNGQQSSFSYVLKVAYGPANVTIEGPSTFVTDGLKPMTLKCNATDVYPSPVYTWDNIYCDSTNKKDVCTFSPKGERDNGKEVVCTVTNGISTTKARYRLDLRYPPLNAPVLTSSSSENSIEKGDIITCSVSGGHPPVTSVTLGCSDPLLVYRLNTTEGSTHNTSLVFTTTPNTNESLLCYCHVLWEPDKGLYERNVTRVFNIKVFKALTIASKHDSFPVGLVVGLVIAENIVLAIVISWVCIRRKNKAVKEAQNQETPEHPYSSVKANNLLSDDITSGAQLASFSSHGISLW
ncbi:uncharacterized protein LOC112567765 [Pomacea canaliculata]|uniref:uncharacterized protein LOC112567765 n=1 Tax=Pomacea canaliculata TaxID=400727 RepID=UPI000D73E903|nr:uncharacterized protein LOC112567765 [Pomacea canaliculata]